MPNFVTTKQIMHEEEVELKPLRKIIQVKEFRNVEDINKFLATLDLNQIHQIISNEQHCLVFYRTSKEEEGLI